MSNDNTANDRHEDNPGILFPPPLTYLLSLLTGLVLDKRFHFPFLPHGVARALGWPLVVSGVLLNGWFVYTSGVPTLQSTPESQCRT